MDKSNRILLFKQFLNEATQTSTDTATIQKKGIEFTNNIKRTDGVKPEWKHMPCYQYVYSYMKEYTPALNPAIMTDFKMAYKKDISSLPRDESLSLTKNSLQVPSQPATMRGLEFVNSKYHIGNIVTIEQAKVGDAINFWVYEFIEFSRIQKNYSYPDTEVKFNNWVKTNKIDVNKLPEWLIEGISLKYGHYGIISDIDSTHIYITSSGEKRGCHGIWSGVPKAECSENFTKLPIADLKKFQNLSYDKMIFQSTDTLSNRKAQVIMRSYILNFIK